MQELTERVGKLEGRVDNLDKKFEDVCTKIDDMEGKLSEKIDALSTRLYDFLKELDFLTDLKDNINKITRLDRLYLSIEQELRKCQNNYHNLDNRVTDLEYKKIDTYITQARQEVQKQ